MDSKRSKLRIGASTFVPKAKPKVQQRDVAATAGAAPASRGATAPPPAADRGALEQLSSMHGVSAEQMERDMDEIYRHMLFMEAQQEELVFDAHAVEVLEGEQQFPPAEWEYGDDGGDIGAQAGPVGALDAGQAVQQPYMQASAAHSRGFQPAHSAAAATAPAGDSYSHTAGAGRTPAPADGRSAWQPARGPASGAAQPGAPGLAPRPSPVVRVVNRAPAPRAAWPNPNATVGNSTNPYS